MSELNVLLRGKALLSEPLLNKGLAFSEAERDAFGLRGLLPRNVETLEEQIDAALSFLDSLSTPLARHVRLREIQDSNETLFYAILERDLERCLPLIYTPTVGEACQKFSQIWQKPRGLFLTYPERDRMEELLADPSLDDVRVIVVTDGERILGLGDQGAGGMGIPIGKLSIYTAAAGIAPEQTLPIMLDTGTNNPELRANPEYIGWKHERVRGAEYDAFIEQFVSAVQKRWPDIILHWEDFAGPNAAPILERYQERLCCFNDDIQGTAAVTTGAILAANHARKGRLRDHTVVMLGSGSAGVGVARLMYRVMRDEGASEEEARGRFYMLDKDGLLTTNRTDLDDGQKLFARSDWQDPATDFETVVKRVRPSILIGVSGVAGLFSEAIVRDMAQHCERPIIFPLSNPTSHSEATPADLMTWTDGRALVSTGSPFPPLKRDGKTHRIDQTNNAYIFPGLSLGIRASGATRATEGMFMAAARGLAAISPLKDDPDGNLLPPVTEMRRVAFAVAEAVASQARKDGVCPHAAEGDLREKIESFIWKPEYRAYRKG
ncbi:malate dehydrogenase [Neoasaia chiangmaiensis NBRC 101099]|uniref:Malolactic enzyme n=1 Tax=Neoasaia chiangmaiensis TaxID=320497 RepID=A0A1U9KRG6_9PROT|nr:NAD-dependent malic enzyme [Neoasaia chiangmaiensis]AQS88403.1 NAD-dependent malic enzyme [Neoasaia chiangmaiensis]GBR39339.1 malate dehydrogenase [Neoasaia chiangmaiensis NBRC 101099]GEN14533.1 NAD-dependent malic enzyme [Neoasaia chiangmaiensis]